MELHMVGNSSATSRRALLSGLTATPFLAIPRVTFLEATIAASPFASTDERIPLRRSKEGRSLSRVRYHRAESFFVSVEAGTPHHRHNQLYQVGIVLQLGLSSHLLDVGFDDTWCARNLGLHVAKSLACANATGLGHSSSDLERLAAILSPYGKWRDADLRRPPPACRFSDLQIRQLTRGLLERVHEITGHPRPRGWVRRIL
jgi:hypothetical protein